MAFYSVQCKIPIIQITHKISISLTEYYIKVNRGNYEFPDFSDYCPICSKENCARFHGFYYRPVVTREGIYHKDFPIIRYKCRNKGNKRVKHVTFSLLPHELIPYVKYSVEFIFKMLFDIYIHGMSEKSALDIISQLCSEEVLCISPASVYSFKCLILKSIDKLNISGFYDEIKYLMNSPDMVKLFVLYLYEINPVRAPSDYGYDFYKAHGFYKTNSPFLFGTPSQFRKYCT